MVDRKTPSEAAADAPLQIVRFSDLRKFVPVGRTRRDELIKAGHLEVVRLTPDTKSKTTGEMVPGRAKGITLRSIRKYQALVMGLAEAEDTAARDRKSA